jgi:hypothetical protein
VIGTHEKGTALQRAFWTLVWLGLMATALWFLNIPSNLKWWEVIGGGVFLGLASTVYRKT